MRISDWSSDVCSSDLLQPFCITFRASRNSASRHFRRRTRSPLWPQRSAQAMRANSALLPPPVLALPSKGKLLARSEEHTSELQSLMRISYAVFCLTKKNTTHAKHADQ